MSDEKLQPLDPTLKALYERDAAMRNVPQDAVERLQSRLAPLLAAGGGISAPPPVGTAAAKAAGWWLPLAKYLSVLAVGSGVGAAVHATVSKPAPPKVVYVDRVVSVPDSAAIACSTPTPATAPPPPAASSTTAVTTPPTARATTSAASASSSPPETGDRDLAGERVLIEIARAALSRGDTGAALEATGRYDRTFPRGQLHEESDALAIQALARAGRAQEAAARAAQFHKRYPHGLFGAVVDQAVPAP
jgi:hypothetical protein